MSLDCYCLITKAFVEDYNFVVRCVVCNKIQDYDKYEACAIWSEQVAKIETKHKMNGEKIVKK